MKFTTFLAQSILLGLTCTAPTEYSDKTSENKTDYPEKYIIYTAEYDIDSISSPLNSLNTKRDNVSAEGTWKPIIFFALADYTNGKREDKGFYILKNGEAMKVLEHGRDAATATDGIDVYIAANDGLYTYNSQSNKAEKYGTVTDDVIGIAKVNGSDIIYILTKDHNVYKVTEQGMKKDKVLDIDYADQIAIDHKNNLYYVANNNVNIFGANVTKKVEGLPENITYIKLIRPPIVLSEGIPVAINNIIYLAFANGTNARPITRITSPPTAYSVDAAVLVYIGHDKKIYEFNVLALILEGLLSEFKERA